MPAKAAADSCAELKAHFCSLSSFVSGSGSGSGFGFRVSGFGASSIQHPSSIVNLELLLKIAYRKSHIVNRICSSPESDIRYMIYVPDGRDYDLRAAIFSFRSSSIFHRNTPKITEGHRKILNLVNSYISISGKKTSILSCPSSRASITCTKLLTNILTSFVRQTCFAKRIVLPRSG